MENIWSCDFIQACTYTYVLVFLHSRFLLTVHTVSTRVRDPRLPSFYSPCCILPLWQSLELIPLVYGPILWSLIHSLPPLSRSLSLGSRLYIKAMYLYKSLLLSLSLLKFLFLIPLALFVYGPILFSPGRVQGAQEIEIWCDARKSQGDMEAERERERRDSTEKDKNDEEHQWTTMFQARLQWRTFFNFFTNLPANFLFHSARDNIFVAR